MMSGSSKRHSKFLLLIFILKCLSKASVIRISVHFKFLNYKDMCFATESRLQIKRNSLVS